MNVEIIRKTGSTPTTTQITSSNTRLNAEDAHSTSGTTNPVKIPDSGTNYSFWATTQLEVTDNTEGYTVDNIKWYTDGSNDLGTDLGMNVATASSYVQATGTTGETGDELTTTNHTGLNASPSDAFAYTSSSPLSVSGSIAGSTGEVGDMVVQQITVGATASVGASTQEQGTFQYDVS